MCDPLICFRDSNTMDSTKATAAHVAFNAPSRSAVDAFFLAGLKAGGRIHGEPALRDQHTGYYSAAIVDFDNNSIEATYRGQEEGMPVKAESVADDKRVLAWQKDVAKSTVGLGSEDTKNTARVIINNVTAPTLTVSRSTAQIRDDGDMSAKAIIGTLLGAAAGAAVAYAMTKGEAENLQSPITQTITYQTVDAAEPQRAGSAVSSKKSSYPAASSHVSRKTLREIDYPQALMSGSGQSVLSHRSSQPKYLEGPNAASAHNLASTLIETFVPPSEVRRFLPHAAQRSHTDSIVQRSVAIQDIDAATQRSRPLRASSTAKTVTLKDFTSVPKSSTGTDATNLARDIPLPVSIAGSSMSGHLESAGASRSGLRSGLGSVAPSDSVSQAGSRRSKTSRHGHNRSEKAEPQDDSSSHASRQTVRYRGNQSGAKKDSAVSLPVRPSSKASAHGSVKSFLHGF